MRLVLSIPLVVALFACNVVHAGQAVSGLPSRIEVFITTDSAITRDADLSWPNAGVMDLQIYELDGIQRIESQLSQGLTADPEQSKQVVLQRFQQLNEDDRARMQQTAIGLAKAVQYGVDRYPAMVFNGRVVIYGVTDINEALHRYRQWREGSQL